MSKKLGSDFEMLNKACHVCDSFDHLKNDCNNRPKAVLSAVKGNKGNAVRASTCWVWRPKHKVLDHGNPQQDLKDKGVIDSGCSRHMTGNRSYLTDYEEIDRGFVAFGGNSKGGKITRKDFKLTDESHVLLNVPRKDNMYSVDLKNVILQGGRTYLFAKAIPDESNLWHRRLGHVNFKTINKLVKGNLVRGLPSKLFEINQTCVACQKGKQHRASYLRVKVIRCDNGTEFKNRVMNQFCEMKGIKREFSVARTPQQNGVAERKNRTLIEAARTMLADLKLPTTFCTEETQDPPFFSSSKDSPNAGFKPSKEEEKKDVEDPGNEDSEVSSIEEPRVNQEKDANVNNTNNNNTVSLIVNAAGVEDNAVDENIVYGCADDPNIPDLEEIGRCSDAKDDDVGAEADMNNLDIFMPVSPIPTTRIHKDHLVEKIIRDLNSAPQTRRMTKNLEEHGLISTLKHRTTHKDLQNCLFACFLSQEEAKRIEAIRLFLAYASFKDFIVYQMDVKSAFLYGKIEEEVYVCQPPGFEDPDFPNRLYKVEKALYGLHQAPRTWYETLSTYLIDNGFQRGKINKTLFIRRDKGNILLVQVYVVDIIFGSTKKSLCTVFENMMHKKFQMSSMGELTFFLGLQVKQKEDGIFIRQDKYVTKILKKFGFIDVKTGSTPMETHKPLLKDTNGEDVNEHLYRSMIGSLMYLTSSRTDIMFAVCQPKLGLWYPKDSPFDLVAYTDSDYAGASLDRKSTTGGCHFLGCRLISWQCKKQNVVANSTTKSEYIAASNCCRQVLWIQNQLLDYGYNFTQTKIHIDNESTICIVKNPVFHSKTKHIEIRHHFIRDSNKKKLIQMIKIHIDYNFTDFLTKAFDVSRFQYLIASIGMLNL
ncbi:putative ribonuclease H-like domain-containing protein [Tanacetum coccineum]